MARAVIADWADEDDDWRCPKCGGEGDVPGRRMGIITPESEQSERPGDYFVCPRCGGSGKRGDQ